jgi:hypothetical protein
MPDSGWEEASVDGVTARADHQARGTLRSGHWRMGQTGTGWDRASQQRDPQSVGCPLRRSVHADPFRAQIHLNPLTAPEAAFI